MEPEMAVTNLTDVVTTNNATKREYIRDLDQSALDGAAFHYSIYRALTRFLGMYGIYDAEGDPSVNFVESWNALMMTNDMSNAYTGEFDPRHMFGISNHDVFRWPGIKNGTEKNLLGLYIITLLFPGIPTLLWGEEQAFYVLESTNANYVFGKCSILHDPGEASTDKTPRSISNVIVARVATTWLLQGRIREVRKLSR